MQTPFSVLTDFCARSDFSEPNVAFNTKDPRDRGEDYVCTIKVYDWDGKCAWGRSAPRRTKKAAKHEAADCLLRNVLMEGEDLPYEWPRELREFLEKHDGHVEKRFNEILNVWNVRGEIPGFRSSEHSSKELCFAGVLLLAEFKRAEKTGLVIKTK